MGTETRPLGIRAVERIGFYAALHPRPTTAETIYFKLSASIWGVFVVLFLRQPFQAGTQHVNPSKLLADTLRDLPLQIPTAVLNQWKTSLDNSRFVSRGLVDSWTVALEVVLCTTEPPGKSNCIAVSQTAPTCPFDWPADHPSL
ncbi:hypothetical protein HL42_2604 [Trichophyton rubrum]|nr:hypothetical protein HL42_2604 [Trichophyton rubrum]